MEKVVEHYFYKRTYNIDFEKLCYEGYLPIRDTAPLHNFTIKNVNVVELDDGLRIKKLTHDDFKSLFDTSDKNHLNIFEVGEPEFVVECDVREQLVRYDKYLKKPFLSEPTIDAVVTALRLLRS